MRNVRKLKASGILTRVWIKEGRVLESFRSASVLSIDCKRLLPTAIAIAPTHTNRHVLPLPPRPSPHCIPSADGI